MTPDARLRGQSAAGEHGALFRRLLDGDLSPAEFRALEQRLQTDAAFRAKYVKAVDFEASLGEELSRLPRVTSLSTATLGGRSRWQSGWWLLAAAAGCLAALLLFWPPASERAAPQAAVSDPNESIEAAPRAPRITHVAVPLQGLPDVAIVTAMDADSSHDRMHVGQRLKPGVLVLQNGELQLDFLGGTRLLLRGPAELHLVSSMAATLVSGEAGVRTPFSQFSFTLSAPESAVVGQWTEFAVRVRPSESTRVRVYAGSVEVSLLGEDGDTLISNRLDARLAVDIDAPARQFVPLAVPPDDLPRAREPDLAQLVVTDDYVREVEHSRPYLYWRFDSLEGDRILDALDGPYPAQLVGDEDGRKSIRIANGMAEFLPSHSPRCIASVEPIPGFNRGDVSIEMWVMPTEVRASALLSTVVPDELPAPLHLNFIEVAHNTNLVHKPGVIRFLHRYPPARSGGYNLFSQEACPPGTWTHLVTTKSSSELRLFINGQLIRSVSGPETAASDEQAYRLVLGQLGTGVVERQFCGMLDEVAVYDRVLRSEEILRHYLSITRGVPLALWQSRNGNQMMIARKVD